MEAYTKKAYTKKGKVVKHDFSHEPFYIEAFQKLLEKVKQNKNDSESQYELALAYYNEMGTKKNIDEALKWFEIAANNGNKNAMFKLGKIYMHNNKIPEALKWYNQVDDFNSNIIIVDYYYKTKNYVKAFEYGDKFLKRFKNGSGDVGIMMGSMYKNGLGTDKDVNKARAEFMLVLKNKYNSLDTQFFAEEMIKEIDDRKHLENSQMFKPSTKRPINSSNSLSLEEEYPDMSNMSNTPVGASGNFQNSQEQMEGNFTFGGSRKRKSKSRKHKASKSKSKLAKRKSKTHKRKSKTHKRKH